MSTTSVALVAALLGALGAISGQVVSSLFTSRRESRRLQWEKERWEADAAREATARFLLTKRALYGDILRAAEDHRRTIWRLEPFGMDAPDHFRRSAEVSQQLEDDPAKRTLLRLEAETALLGSDQVLTELSSLIESMESPGFDGDVSDLVSTAKFRSPLVAK